MLDVLESIPKSKKNSKKAKNAIQDYWICLISREASLMGRKDVLSGKGKFGIFGDGKELAQVALARHIQQGDFRSGYYRDQTIFFALELSSVEDFFAQLYADAEHDPFTGGRQMNAHFATALIDQSGDWIDHREQALNSSGDISSTAGQMARSLGLAMASKMYRESNVLPQDNLFSRKGDEVAFVTIGDASTSEGVFWETINAAVVTKVPLVVCVWDDGYGISVPRKYQTATDSISQALSGMQSDKSENGLDIYKVKAYDYEGLNRTFADAIAKTRKNHIPALIHVQDVTQPQGHSTSGSHERYKSKERLEWEIQMDGNKHMGDWLVKQGYLSEEDLVDMQAKAKKFVRDAKTRAWQRVGGAAKKAHAQLIEFSAALGQAFPDSTLLVELNEELNQLFEPSKSEVVGVARKIILALAGQDHPIKAQINDWIKAEYATAEVHYHSHLMAAGKWSALEVDHVPAVYADEAPQKNGYEILNANFDSLLAKYPEFCAFGEDLGFIGDVNQGFAGLQAKYGVERVFDTGIREWTIMGQAIGLSMRGLRPLAEIQYVDYLVYGLAPLTDDLATVRYRSNGQQAAPAIIRTRGHRLEGIWHSGSPMGMIVHTLRGMHVCVPRNMTQAAGMYNTLLQSKDPAIVVECLNGYRLKEKLPENIGEFNVPLGMPEVLREGTDITLVTYGTCVRIAQEAIEFLAKKGISVELVDVQTLLPFDLTETCLASIRKTNRVVFLDEDVPGGASAYMMQQVLDGQGAYQYLDSAPVCLSAKAHRPPYGSEGDYYSKPNAEDVIELIYGIMNEANPQKHPEK